MPLCEDKKMFKRLILSILGVNVLFVIMYMLLRWNFDILVIASIVFMLVLIFIVDSIGDRILTGIESDKEARESAKNMTVKSRKSV